MNEHDDEAPLDAIDDEGAMLYDLRLFMVKQFSLNKGLKEFIDRAKEVTMKEITQIHYMDMYSSLDISTLTWEQKKRAPLSLLFLVERRSGETEGRICVDGSK